MRLIFLFFQAQLGPQVIAVSQKWCSRKPPASLNFLVTFALFDEAGNLPLQLRLRPVNSRDSFLRNGALISSR